MSKSTNQSRFLSLILRHKPEEIGLTLDPEGWAAIDEIVAKSKLGLTQARIAEIAADCPKQRFAISDDGRFIRANQGHSLKVDLALEAMEPPETLYHGTAETTVPLILAKGLKPGSRQYVHLSPDVETATRVGQRHGKPVVLHVKALDAHRAGQAFYLAKNGVWLTDPLSPAYIVPPS